MRLYLKFTYQISKDEPFGNVYRRIQDYFLDVYELKKQWFKFEDSFMSKHRGTNVVIQKYPEMREFLYFSKREWGNEIFEEPVLSNLDDTWVSPNPYKNLGDLREKQFLSILQNIPGIYPFIRASIAFDLHIASQLDALPDKENPVHAHYKREFLQNTPYKDSTLVFIGELSEKNRNNQLVFYLRLPNSVYHANTLPELPSSILGSIHGIGSVETTEAFYIPDEIEFSQWGKKNKEARQLLGEGGQNLYDELVGLKKPNELPDPFFLLKNAKQKPNQTDKKIPKESIVKFYFGLKGYHYRPKLDTRESITLGKSTKNNNSLHAVLIFGSHPSQLSCLFKIRGLFWEERIRVPILSDYYQYPIVSRDSFEKAVENMAAVVVYIEKNIVPKIENICGSSPDWFKTSGEIYKMKNLPSTENEVSNSGIENQVTKNKNQETRDMEQE
ncbi:hypothetical protein JW835_01750 [bacterium]|nr:hypothetical protein [bacterium]